MSALAQTIEQAYERRAELTPGRAPAAILDAVDTALAELDLRPRVPPALMADATVAFIDGLALDVANGSAREPRVSYDIFWLALISLTE